ncbi:hypothetical protein GF374_02015 [Candidatus Woesearchaeota archaeon]|nr:hypothetical protein [Candidatus Woesearchaeota archaeon]
MTKNKKIIYTLKGKSTKTALEAKASKNPEFISELQSGRIKIGDLERKYITELGYQIGEQVVRDKNQTALDDFSLLEELVLETKDFQKFSDETNQRRIHNYLSEDKINYAKS